MRDLLYRNLTSSDKKRRVVASAEVVDRQGIRSVIRRHFICILKEVESNAQAVKPKSAIRVIKEHNSRDHRERFFCSIKGSVYAVNKDKLYLVLFMHSLSINLTPSVQKVC